MPPIPKKSDGDYDFKGLREKLSAIKGEFPAETKATFNADGHVPYELVVQTLDAMRLNTEGKTLFPDVVFAAGLL
jgi:biopolymer transport protein ExbD